MSFVEGDILQTNEIFVLLGADYFVRTSTYNAGKILQRRKVALEEAIKKSSVYDIGDVSGKQLNNLTDEGMNMCLQLRDSPISEAEHEEVIKKLAKLEALEQTTQMGKEKSEDSFTEAFSGVVKEKTANDAGLTQQFSWKKGKNDEKNRVSRFRQLRS